MELLERELYLDALNSAFAGASGGNGCIALVSGEAGIGKTSLIQQFVADRGRAARTPTPSPTSSGWALPGG